MKAALLPLAAHSHPLMSALWYRRRDVSALALGSRTRPSMRRRLQPPARCGTGTPCGSRDSNFNLNHDEAGATAAAWRPSPTLSRPGRPGRPSRRSRWQAGARHRARGLGPGACKRGARRASVTHCGTASGSVARSAGETARAPEATGMARGRPSGRHWPRLTERTTYILRWVR